ncbi:hypothetical protein OO007_10520 [Cocleimonas sp. KMM 6892]|uniref:hypothetical protein n=1 Tax=unclassified Cocleimonas TaxID=2639732 RepID=UPI002DBDA4C3|nr:MULTISPECIES: hypothetical protein [unclassified Cocleimonas]MEB8432660.1 hypothetical protein [Cocleimonas sp. KMM 6892]MEC4715519.1 hypothetical protein [Cocleimonas sp. KMM 6895]MEC4744863.1 hypothetical protein [Cocleimonas sp. KMM 6896]
MKTHVKSLMILPCFMLLVACGGEKESAAEDKPNAVVEKATAPVKPTKPDVAVTPKINNAKLPFDLPIMPDARYISGSLKFSRPTKKRGGEAIATIAAKGTPLDVVKYYEKALADIGFTAELGKHNSGSVAKVSGVSKTGEKFLITSMRGGSKTQEGESQTSIIATKPL